MTIPGNAPPKGYPISFTGTRGVLSSAHLSKKLTAAKTLAKASVWFSAFVGESCAIDKNKYTYYRYQFDKEGKLEKTTEKSYCGDLGVK